MEIVDKNKKVYHIEKNAENFKFWDAAEKLMTT